LLPHNPPAPSAHDRARSSSQIRGDLARGIFRGAQMNDLCRKVKWSERPEPRASNIPGLGAWTRPPDRRWRITARGTLLAFRVLAAGAGKTSNTGQSASKSGQTRGDKRSVFDHKSP